MSSARTKLSDRVRPDCEASPWVLEEIKDLEDKLAAVEQAIDDYHYALDTRQHGGVAQDTAFNAIRSALDKRWEQGAELKKRGGG